MKGIARLIRLDGVVASIRTRQTNGFLESISRKLPVAKRQVRGHTRIATARTVIPLLDGTLDFRAIKPQAGA